MLFDDYRINPVCIDYASRPVGLECSEHERFYKAQWKSKNQDEFLGLMVCFAERVIDDPDEKLRELFESDQVYANAKRSIHCSSVKRAVLAPCAVWGLLDVS